MKNSLSAVQLTQILGCDLVMMVYVAKERGGTSRAHASVFAKGYQLRDITPPRVLSLVTSRDSQSFCLFCITSTKFSQSVDRSFEFYDMVSFSFLSEVPRGLESGLNGLLLTIKP